MRKVYLKFKNLINITNYLNPLVPDIYWGVRIGYQSSRHEEADGRKGLLQPLFLLKFYHFHKNGSPYCRGSHFHCLRKPPDSLWVRFRFTVAQKNSLC